MALTLLALLVLIVPLVAIAYRPRKQWNPRGKHCYVTGGSSGLGQSLAVLLAKAGANVSVVARNQGRLNKTLSEMEAVRHSPNQILRAYSFSLGDAESSAKALEAACEPHTGQSPDVVFLCAGASTPGFFLEQDERTLKKGMEDGYWVQALSALAAAKRMVGDGTQGKIVFVSSVLGYMSIIGYSSYSPAKHALRGLAETLRSEMLLYGIGVHIMFPGTIYTPGYEEENHTKPKITLKIEESDSGSKPEHVARMLLEGVERGHFHISVDFITNIFRTSTRGSTPFHNFLLDGIYEIIGSVALLFWRRSVDSTVRAHRVEHEQYLHEHGILANKVSAPATPA